MTNTYKQGNRFSILLGGPNQKVSLQSGFCIAMEKCSLCNTVLGNFADLDLMTRMLIFG